MIFKRFFSFVHKTIAVYYFFFLSIDVYAQKQSNQVFLDSADVIQIVKSRNAYWSNGFSPNLYLELNAGLQEWKVISTKTKHTRVGQCKYTNGCTKITQWIWILDAKTGKVKSRRKQKQLYYNYE